MVAESISYDTPDELVEALPQVERHTGQVVRVGSHTWEQDIALNDLELDETYQRTKREHWVNSIAKNFDQDLFGKPLVAKRLNSRYLVVNGQHRIDALYLVYQREIEAGATIMVRCDVFASTSVKEEAKQFRGMNSETLRPSAAENFKARLAEDDPVALDIQRIAHECGFELWLTGGALPPKDKIGAIASLERIYGKRRGQDKAQGRLYITGSPEFLREILSILRDARQERGQVTAFILDGTAAFLNRYHGHKNYRRERLVEILRETDSDAIMTDARSIQRSLRSGSIAKSTGMLILQRYNYRLADNNRLPAWD